VLKIENRQAFEDLPRLLLTALRYPPMGVMVARGDLGVELGFERMAEVQEEILWLCEAAHVPVIWATQVLEGLAKKGLPSRGEVTDAAMGFVARRVRDAEQGHLHREDGQVPRRRAGAHARPPPEEDIDAAQAEGLGGRWRSEA